MVFVFQCYFMKIFIPLGFRKVLTVIINPVKDVILLFYKVLYK